MAADDGSWDPLRYKGAERGEKSRECRKRVRKDLKEIMKNPLEGIFAWCALARPTAPPGGVPPSDRDKLTFSTAMRWDSR